MKLIFPNKPVTMFTDSLQELDDENEWFAQQKLDGWRCLLLKDTEHEIVKNYGGNESWDRGDGLFFLSRRGTNSGGPTELKVSDEIVEVVKGFNLPDKTMIDSEWCERRTKEDGIPECLYVHDLMWLEDQWLGKTECWERYSTLVGLLATRGIIAGEIGDISGMTSQLVRFPDMVESGFVDFFELQKSKSWTEGLVLKNKDHMIKGSKEECKKHALWVKIKWRDGHDGRKVVA